ncbi:MAG: type IV pilus modification protein PilV [Gammaproteobacteria bacterium]|jgi:type IV pilus assembly protein PilV|nr:type IV pilus modification protein PilV [Gammaproteobacteria bacterium]
MTRKPPAAARGFTLIEVLVALAIFTIGLLGIAGLQVAGMRFTQGAQLRSVATIQAENMADRMRANRVGVLNGFYNTEGKMPSSITKDCNVNSCSPAELASFDLFNWNTANGSSKPRESNPDALPGGSGVVCLDSTPIDGIPGDWQCDNLGIVYAIKLTWDERTASGSDTTDDTNQRLLVMRVLQ